MDAFAAARVTDWLEACRGIRTQQELADDITATIGWHITRDRYSKYESGSLPIGPQTYKHFVDYWKAKGKEGPDLTPSVAPDPEPSLIEVLAAHTQAIIDLVDEMRLARERDQDAAAAMLAAAEALVGAIPKPESNGASTGHDAPLGTAG